MSDLRRASLLACVLIVVLRLSIGWQFIYEGLWKLKTANGPQPWTAAGYLNNAHGPMREYFRNMTGDPDELNWLDSAFVNARWDRWAESFQTHYELSEDQQRELTALLEGPKTRSVTIKELPPEIDVADDLNFKGSPFKYDSENKTLSIDAWAPATPTEFAALLNKIPQVEVASTGADETAPIELTKVQTDFLKQLQSLEKSAANLSYKQKLKSTLEGNPNVTGVVYDDEPKKGEDRIQMRPKADEADSVIKVGERQTYQAMLEDYNEKLAVADQPFEFDHLQTLWGKIQAKKAEIVGPVKALDSDLKQEARKILTYEQITRGPVPPEPTKIAQIDRLTIWALLILGGLLLVGFCTRLAAIAGAGMLMSFYMVWPPFPGVPEAVGPEHSLIVNKNSIEAVALLAIAALPTGTWFGLDAWVSKAFQRKPKEKGKSLSAFSRQR